MLQLGGIYMKVVTSVEVPPFQFHVSTHQDTSQKPSCDLCSLYVGGKIPVGSCFHWRA